MLCWPPAADNNTECLEQGHVGADMYVVHYYGNKYISTVKAVSVNRVNERVHGQLG